MIHLTRVGVLRGGPSSEYEVSLRSGAAVLAALRDRYAHQYQPHDIFIDRQGNWHFDGVSLRREEVVPRIDVAFNALHGSYGEDGKVQQFMETHHLPFTGSGSLASAVGMNKILAKRAFAAHGIRTPAGKEVSSAAIRASLDEIVAELFESCILPVIVKPAAGGSSLGVAVVRSYADFPRVLAEAAAHGQSVLIEEFIPGVEATCGVIESFRGHELYALPPVEIRPHADQSFFNYDAKYAGKSQELVPATFSHEVKAELEKLAKSIHRLLGLRHYSRADFIIHPRRGIYALETNTLPGLTEESLVPRALHAVGGSLDELIIHLLALAHKRT